MKKFIDTLNAIARKHNIAASVVADAALKILKEKYGVNAPAPENNAPADDTPATPLPVQVFGKPVTPAVPAADDVADNENAAVETPKFKVGSIYASRNERFIDGVKTDYFRKPVKIVKLDEKYISFVRVNPRDFSEYEHESAHRTNLYRNDKDGQHFYTGRGQWENHYLASDVVTDPSQVDY